MESPQYLVLEHLFQTAPTRLSRPLHRFMVDIDALLQGNRRALAKAITLIESHNPAHRRAADELLEAIMPLTGKAFRLGHFWRTGRG